jgi:hypothetical protein
MMAYREHRVSVKRPERLNKYRLLIISKATKRTLKELPFNGPNPARAYAVMNFDSDFSYQINCPTGEVVRLFEEYDNKNLVKRR